MMRENDAPKIPNSDCPVADVIQIEVTQECREAGQTSDNQTEATEEMEK